MPAGLAREMQTVPIFYNFCEPNYYNLLLEHSMRKQQHFRLHMLFGSTFAETEILALKRITFGKYARKK